MKQTRHERQTFYVICPVNIIRNRLALSGIFNLHYKSYIRSFCRLRIYNGARPIRISLPIYILHYIVALFLISYSVTGFTLQMVAIGNGKKNIIIMAHNSLWRLKPVYLCDKTII